MGPNFDEIIGNPELMASIKIFGIFSHVDEKINELIYKQASEAEITDYVFKNNKKIFLNGLEAVIAGETSITEILRVSQE